MPLSHLIIGLGNPGPEYRATRHNIGFMAVDRIAERQSCAAWKNKFKSLIAAPPAADFLLLKPQTFMNLSGEAAGEALRFHKLAPEQVIVFHDDLDLPAGAVRVKQGGGSGGHNGLKSLDAHIGQNYWRVRIGIGRPDHANGEKNDAVTHYVLGDFAKADQAWIEPLLETMAKNIDFILRQDFKSFISALQPPR